MPITLPDARLPEGLRVYALGDVHGERDAAAEMIERIRRDRAERPVDDWREIWLGDLIDRGPDSAGAMDLAARAEEREHRIVLLGNHDVFLRDFIDTGDPAILAQWLSNGGVQACASWGIDLLTLDETVNRHGAHALRDLLASRLSPAQRALLGAMKAQVALGDFAFVHAGIRPGIPLEAQAEDDLVWIRHGFLDHAGAHEHVVVHGHTPRSGIEVLPNRVGVDTGAGKGGHLSCLVIEGGTLGRLDADGLVPLL